jgi:hypothetical protein
MYVCIHTHVRVHKLPVRTRNTTHIVEYICRPTYPAYIHTYIHNTYMHTHNAYIHTHTCIRTYIPAYTYTHANIHTHIHTCVHTYTYIYTYIHTCLHTCIHAYTYTHTYTPTYIHIHPNNTNHNSYTHYLSQRSCTTFYASLSAAVFLFFTPFFQRSHLKTPKRACVRVCPWRLSILSV